MKKYGLYVILGAIIAVYAGEWVLNTVLTGPLEELDSKRSGYERKIKKAKKELSQAVAAAKRLNAYEQRSLPSDPEVARSLYQAWLLELVDHVGLTERTVNSSQPMRRKGLFSVISFSLRAKGTLEQLTRFLFEFYNYGHLHQIRSISMTPMQKTGELDLSITIEAASLPGADRKDSLTQERDDRLASTTLEAYSQIAARDFFAVGGGLDPTDQTFLSAVTDVDGQPQAWFTLRETDELLKLAPGAVLTVGQFRGVVAEIEDQDVILESEGRRWLLTIGECLTDAYALPPEY